MRMPFSPVAAVVSALLVAACAGTVIIPVATPGPGGIHVRLMKGAGPSGWSYGVDEIGAMEAKIPGVTSVEVYDYTQYLQVIADVDADAADVSEVVGGFSCGANTSPVVAAGTKRRIALVEVIQASKWCGGVPIPKNVDRAQETYNPNPLDTGGLGSKLLALGPGFVPSHFTVIQRHDCHLCADVDPDAQNDMVDGVRMVAAGIKKRGAPLKAGVDFVTLRSGQRLMPR